MEFKLMHFGLCCKDTRNSLAFYQGQLENELTARFEIPNEVDIAFVGKGADTTMELLGTYTVDEEKAKILKDRNCINHISFQVEDAELAFKELKSKGAKVAWELRDLGKMKQCGFFDADGLIFEVYNYTGKEAIASPDYRIPVDPTELTLHHVSIVTHDLIKSEKFYVEKLGLKRVAESFNKKGGGFIYLVDPFYDGQRHGFMLEIIGPPELEEREEELLKKHGPLFDHLCYTAEDVKGAWQAAIDRGTMNFIEPYVKYGSHLAWLKDADENDVKIMEPFPEELIDLMVNGTDPVDISA